MIVRIILICFNPPYLLGDGATTACGRASVYAPDEKDASPHCLQEEWRRFTLEIWTTMRRLSDYYRPPPRRCRLRLRWPGSLPRRAGYSNRSALLSGISR